MSEKERIEFIDAQTQPKEKRKGVLSILDGSILSKDKVSSQIPYTLFLALLALIYIGNKYRYEKLVREGQKVQVEVKNLRAESITTAAQLMHISKQSQVARMVEEKGLGLEASVVPPKKIKAKL
ncbi:MAG: FtsL-like putative cell division protein [Bacteroidales bacterium]|nr:FtsL-like putative cell division protein [Tenuifilaceae bacterium]